MIVGFTIATGASALMAFLLLRLSSLAKSDVLTVIYRTIAIVLSAVCMISLGTLLPMLSLEYAAMITDDHLVQVSIHFLAFIYCGAIALMGFVVLTKQAAEFLDDLKWAIHYKKT